MNILFLSTEVPYPLDSGHRLRTFNILKHVAKKHNVFFLGFLKNREDVQHIGPIEQLCKSTDTFIIPDDISKFRFFLSLFLNIFSAMPYVADKYYRKEYKNRIKEIIRNNKMDIVHFDMLHLARYRKHVKAIPTVLVEHNVESYRVFRVCKNSKNLFFKLYMYLQYIKLYHFEKKECACYNICTAVSANDRNTLKEMNSSANIIEVPNGVDTNYFRPNNKVFIPNSLVWVGDMGDMYNKEAIDYFCMDIFPLIQLEIPEVIFTAIGKSPTKFLLQLSSENKNVTPVGYVDDVRPFINSAALYIAPIKSGGGTKLKILNALSMAKAVVTTSVGAEGIDVQNNKHIIIVDDPNLFAKETVMLLKDVDHIKIMGNNGRRRMVEKYDWKMIGKKMNEVYASITSTMM